MVDKIKEICMKCKRKTQQETAKEIFKEIEKIHIMDLWRFEVIDKIKDLKKKFCEVK